MDYFEQKALGTEPHGPRWWHRYVDDTHIMLKKIHSQEFTDHLNSLDDDSKWTTEGEVVLEVPVERSAMAREEEDSVRMERALFF